MARSSAIILMVLVSCGDKPPPHLIDAGVPDDSSACDSCNPVSQIGCNPNQKCTLLKIPAVSTCDIGCAPSGNVADGLPCNSEVDSCVDGTVCLDDRCRAFCDANHRCNRGLCWPSTLDPKPFLVQTCAPPCDPLNVSCPSGMECFFPVSGADGSPGCLSPGTRALDDRCLEASDCASGLSCAGETTVTLGFATCQTRCIVSQNDCASPTVCHERTVGDGYGICLPP
jgi:hypothetical protein